MFVFEYTERENTYIEVIFIESQSSVIKVNKEEVINIERGIRDGNTYVIAFFETKQTSKFGV